MSRSLRNKRLLVIGGAGFIGSHLVEALLGESPAEILVYDDFSRGKPAHLESALRDPRVSVFEKEASILETDRLDRAFRGREVVFHLAALWLLHCQEHPEAAFEVNIRGTFNVLQACVQHRTPRLVFSSSASVYGDAVEFPMREGHPLNNTTFYGATKIAGEQMCRAHHHRYGLDYAALRYMNVYGPRQDDKGAYTSVIMKVLERIERGEAPVIHGDGSQSYDFVDVTDVARANVLAARAQANDQAFNVGTGRRTTIRELVERLLEATGSTLTPIFQSEAVSFVQHRVGSTEAAQRALGFRAAVSLETGLKKLVASRSSR
ncbi:MAG: NAD-dependent dehydratase [Candidatus Omnitrophica bacterium CG11_big_fil_rev_8_21_14_0_20_64_10]|nr:MAG: NAD-dependent dehydratase [Candidatus Omnitrophica bacterium CG11_big_fil_rev_8_21_14_0_20_64_10]